MLLSLSLSLSLSHTRTRTHTLSTPQHVLPPPSLPPSLASADVLPWELYCHAMGHCLFEKLFAAGECSFMYRYI
jgi:hypothetical protein